MISAWWRSFYSAAFYREAQRWRGMAIAYLALTVFLCWIPSFIKIHVGFKRFCTLFETKFVPQIPPVRFENGRVITPEKKPYVLTYAGSKALAIVDTSGRYDSLENTDAQFLLTQRALHIRKSQGEVRTYDLTKSRTKPIVIDQNFLLRAERLLRRWIAASVYGAIFALSFIKRILQAFLIGLVGLIPASWVDSELDLGELFSLATVSMTPAMIVETAWAATGRSFQYQWAVWGILIAGYFIFALNAATDKTAVDDSTLVDR